MNYFSHYYFDYLPGEETHNFGLMMPDFVRNFLRGQKLRQITPDEVDTAPNRLLAVGAQKHFHRDHLFHGSTYFSEAEKELTNIIKPVFQDLQIGRYWFAAHLLSEMMIDRVLMKQEPDMLDQFYTDLDNADKTHINSFLKWKGIEDTETFQERFHRFSQSQYLRQYTHNPAMVYSLNRIYMYTGAGGEWSTEQYRKLESIIPVIEEYIAGSLPTLFSEMK